ncbi:MAG: transketolase family protein [Candidatus Caenarcaniphilales bacterium]|nr:transketolase family protein [Candidatus Caenarcaniphilales bacterium]
MMATRQAYGEALLEFGALDPDLVVLDADLSGSTGTSKFAKAYPERFFNLGIAEQNMISVAAGLSLSGKKPFASSFAMFATGRAWEQVRNSVAHNHANVKIAASHAGITLGQDGASHQIIEDIGIMSVIPGMTVLVPADATETRAMVRALLSYEGPAYLRLGRPPVPRIFEQESFQFQIGKAQIVRSGEDITLIALGVMLSKTLEAADLLTKEGIKAEVINLSTVKPLDSETILQSITKTGCAVVAEEHNFIGGVSQMISFVLATSAAKHCPLSSVAIQDTFGQSGEADRLLEIYGLTTDQIVSKAKAVIKRK